MFDDLTFKNMFGEREAASLVKVILLKQSKVSFRIYRVVYNRMQGLIGLSGLASLIHAATIRLLTGNVNLRPFTLLSGLPCKSLSVTFSFCPLSFHILAFTQHHLTITNNRNEPSL